MRRATTSAWLSALLCSAAFAQDPHAGHHATPAAQPANPPASSTAEGEAAAPVITGASLPVGDAAPPAVVLDNVADEIHDPARMARARAVLAEEHGGARVSKVMANLFELTSGDGGGYRWDAEAWYGGDIQRFVFKTEGDGLRDEKIAAAELQALYSRAVGAYTDVQAGLRYELEPEGRAYATVAVESLLPYWFHVQAAIYLSDRGDFLSSLEGSHDFQLTQRMVLQPRAELTLAAQDVPDVDIGSGLSSVELGLRLRYEIRHEFAPYIGVSYERDVGRTADFARAAGQDVADTRFVLGLQAWF